MTELIGSIAAVCTTISFVPQAIKTIRSKQTKDISLIMYLLFTTGIALWLAYGILINKMPIILANAVTLVLVIPILVMKLIYK
jgi:MtN3 and saliva related transmembrane protein